MRYVIARYHEIQRDKAYRIYITDALKAIAENTQRFCGGVSMQSRFYEIAYDDTPKKSEKTAEQVKAEILETFKKLEVGKE